MDSFVGILLLILNITVLLICVNWWAQESDILTHHPVTKETCAGGSNKEVTRPGNHKANIYLQKRNVNAMAVSPLCIASYSLPSVALG